MSFFWNNSDIFFLKTVFPIGRILLNPSIYAEPEIVLPIILQIFWIFLDADEKILNKLCNIINGMESNLLKSEPNTLRFGLRTSLSIKVIDSIILTNYFKTDH